MHVTPMIENHFEILWKLLEKARAIVTVTPSKYFLEYKIENRLVTGIPKPKTNKMYQV